MTICSNSPRFPARICADFYNIGIAGVKNLAI
jgi:hypothetical protein